MWLCLALEDINQVRNETNARDCGREYAKQEFYFHKKSVAGSNVVNTCVRKPSM